MICDMSNSDIAIDAIDSFAKRYMSLVKPEWYNVTYLPRHLHYALALENVALDSDDVVLDVGGACSYFAVFIAPQVKEVHVVDSLTGFSCAGPWLASMETLDTEVHITQANAAVLPFPDDMFDTVFTFSALEHFVEDDDLKCVREIHRVLKPGGIFAGTVDFNPISEKPQGEDNLCKTYTLRTFFKRILLSADFWPVGGIKMDRIPDVVTCIESGLFFVLSKGIPAGRMLNIGAAE